MHPRFARARRTAIACPGGAVEVAVAENFRLRLAGLMGLEAEEVEPLLFPRCRSIHTFGMKTPIDLVWLAIEGNEGRAIGEIERLKPRRFARAPRDAGSRGAIAALELPAGTWSVLFPLSGNSVDHAEIKVRQGAVRPSPGAIATGRYRR